MSEQHNHVWNRLRDESETRSSNGLKASVITRYETCACGEDRPSKRNVPRPPFRRIRETEHALIIARTSGNIAIAESLLAYDDTMVPWKGRRSGLIKSFTDAELETALNELALAGLLKIHDRFQAGSWHTHLVEVPSEAALEDHVEPGRREQLDSAIKDAQRDLPQTKSAQQLNEFLMAGAARWEPETITWAAAAIRHGAAGKTSLIRQFSADIALSKDFERHRARIEKVLDLEELGLRAYPSQLLVGGRGLIRFPDDELRVSPAWGTVGIERARLREATLVEGRKVVFVENRTVFHAAAAGHVPPLEGSLVIFSGGTVGSTAEHLARIAQGEILGWMDLDPEGVRMIRDLHAASSGRLTPYRMNPSEMTMAEAELPGGRRAATLASEIKRGGILQDLLLEISRTEKWLEQERQLSVQKSLQ